MCGVTVTFDQESRFTRIHTHYCDNHPACYTLRGQIIRPPPPESPGGSSKPSVLQKVLNRRSAPSGSISFREAASVAAGEDQGTANPLRRAVSTRSESLKSGLKLGLEMLTDLGDKRPKFCIMIVPIYWCGHDVQIEPKLRGWACTRPGCWHWKRMRTHFIQVPMRVFCTRVEDCPKQIIVKQARLYEAKSKQLVMLEQNPEVEGFRYPAGQ